jgi:hypothetical protein
MLRLTRKSKSKISNQLAVIAALMLITSAVVGADLRSGSTQTAEQAMTAAATDQSALFSQQSKNSIQAKRKKGFKTRLFLFRRG